jgi:hypothetical protein
LIHFAGVLSTSYQIHFASRGIFDFSPYHSQNKLRQHQPERTGPSFLLSFFSQPFIWTAQARPVSAQAAAKKN